MSKAIRLELTGDEALVLLDLLERLDNRTPPVTEEPAERVALWRLTGQLESQLVEVVDPDYAALVAAARSRLSDPAD